MGLVLTLVLQYKGHVPQRMFVNPCLLHWLSLTMRTMYEYVAVGPKEVRRRWTMNKISINNMLLDIFSRHSLRWSSHSTLFPDQLKHSVYIRRWYSGIQSYHFRSSSKGNGKRKFKLQIPLFQRPFVPDNNISSLTISAAGRWKILRYKLTTGSCVDKDAKESVANQGVW